MTDVHHLRTRGWVLAVILLAGCAATQTIDASYASQISRLPNAGQLERVAVGVVNFVDTRPIVNAEDRTSASYVAIQGSWNFGLTYDGKEYVPVRDVLQDVLVDDHQRAGLTAKPLGQVVGEEDFAKVAALGEQNAVDYVVSGEILVFEFVNEVGVLTVDTRRSVRLNVFLTPSQAPAHLPGNNGERVRP